MHTTIQNNQTQNPLTIKTIKTQNQITPIIMNKKIIFLQTQNLKKNHHPHNITIIITKKIDPPLQAPPAHPIQYNNPINLKKHLNNITPNQITLKITIKKNDHIPLTTIQINHTNTIKHAHLSTIISIPFHINHYKTIYNHLSSKTTPNPSPNHTTT